MTIKTSSDAYKMIHGGLYAAVEFAVEECNHEEAIKYADMMAELEKDRVSVIETYGMDGEVFKEYNNG